MHMNNPSSRVLLRQARCTVVVLCGCAASACATRAPQPVGAPAPDPGSLATALVAATRPAHPRQVGFNWTLSEAGARVNGRGVVRVVAPERIRLDLFGPRNETYLAAALVGDAYRLPRGVTMQVALPSPAILWGGLGVVRPPTAATLASAVTTESGAVLRYRAEGGDVYQYVFAGSGTSARLDSVERLAGGGRLESVNLTRDEAGQVRRAQYRNWGAYRELTLDIQEMKDVASFPEAIWQP